MKEQEGLVRTSSPGRDSERTAAPSPMHSGPDIEGAPWTGNSIRNREKQKEYKNDVYEMDENDPERPANWSRRKKIATTLVRIRHNSSWSARLSDGRHDSFLL